MSSDGYSAPRRFRRWLGYYHAALLLLVVADAYLLQIARLGKWSIAATLFYGGLGLMALLVVSAIADKALVRSGNVAKDDSENQAAALDVMVERPAIERKSFEARRAEERDEPSSVYRVHGGEMPASLCHGARISWFIPPLEGSEKRKN